MRNIVRDVKWQHFPKIPREISLLPGSMEPRHGLPCASQVCEMKITYMLYLTFRKEYIIMIAFFYQKD